MSVRLTIRGLSKSYTRHLLDGKRLAVLRDVDLELEPGTFTLLTGPSGSGKSSLLRCIYRSAIPDAGSMVLQIGHQSTDLAAADARTMLALRRTTIGMATQFLSVVPRIGAQDLIVEMGLARDEAGELLSAVGLPEEHFDVPPATFSGGQRQMLNLALALARRQPLLLLDEVTASLDRGRRVLAYRALLERKEAGVTMLAVSHEVPDVPGLVDRVVSMNEGMVVA